MTDGGLACSQSRIFRWDRLDISRLTVVAILIFKRTEGAGVGDYSSGGGASSQNALRPLTSFDTNVMAARNVKLWLGNGNRCK